MRGKKLGSKFWKMLNWISIFFSTLKFSKWQFPLSTSKFMNIFFTVNWFFLSRLLFNIIFMLWTLLFCYLFFCTFFSCFHFFLLCLFSFWNFHIILFWKKNRAIASLMKIITSPIARHLKLSIENSTLTK